MNNHCGKSKLGKILMLLCCILPIIVMAYLMLSRVEGVSGTGILGYGLLLLCPLSHLLILPLIIKKNAKGKQQLSNGSNPIIENNIDKTY